MRMRVDRIRKLGFATIVASLALFSEACGGATSGGNGHVVPSTPMPDAEHGPKTSIGNPVDAALFGEGPCGGFESLSLASAPTSLLDDRLTMVTLDGLSDMARPRSVMEAPAAEQGETRLFLENGGKKLVVFVEELFKRPGADFAAAVKKFDKEDGPVKQGAFALGGLPAIAIVPERLVATSEAVLALRVYVATPDDTVERVTFYVSPSVIDQGAGCPALARKMALTLKPGRRALDLSGGKRKLDAGASITVPSGMAIMPEPGPDFMVYHLYPVNPLGSPDGTLGVYFGGYPEPIDPGTEVSSGKLFGKTAKWVDTRAEGRHVRQSLVEVPGAKGLFAHVFFGADDETMFGSLAKVAETIE